MAARPGSVLDAEAQFFIGFGDGVAGAEVTALQAAGAADNSQGKNFFDLSLSLIFEFVPATDFDFQVDGVAGEVGQSGGFKLHHVPPVAVADDKFGGTGVVFNVADGLSVGDASAEAAQGVEAGVVVEEIFGNAP